MSAQQSLYDNAWRDYAAGLSTQNGTADDQYYLSAMTLKTMQDKSNGAMIAGIGTPWGFAAGERPLGYHLVWSRDMFKFANALIAAGDTASAASAVRWLFNTDLDSAAGRFPQRALVSDASIRLETLRKWMNRRCRSFSRTAWVHWSTIRCGRRSKSCGEFHFQQWSVDRAGTLGGNRWLFAVDHSR